VSGPVSAPPAPFKGLAPFEDSAFDALLFFGREREIEVIVANLMANRLTVLYGPSGVGKTSLLRAGLAQRLRQDPEAVVVVASSWGGDPVEDLLDATENTVRALADPPLESLRRTGSLADTLGSLARRLDNDVYLVLDQFEEYFLYHEGESGPGSLMDDLPEALGRRGLRANFLIGTREDSLAQLDAFKGRIPHLFANTLRLDPLDRRAGEAAIVGPIREYNRLRPGEPPIEIEPALVYAVLDEVATGRVDLGLSGRGGVEEEADEGRIEAPYLQLVLERLWDVETSRGSRRLRLDTLRELGGAARVVQDHLERAMSELSPDEKDAAAAMYNHLVTPSGAKIAHGVGDLAGYAGVDEADAGRVLTRLVGQRIVRVGGDSGGGSRYEIFHDVLADAVLAWRSRHEADRRLEVEREAAEMRHRRTLTFAIAAVVAVAVLGAISIYALTQRSNARSEARHARAREIAALASLQLPDDPEGSLRLALEANALEPSPRTERVLRTVLRELRVLAVLRGGGPVTSVAFSPDSEFALTADKGGEARLFRVSTGRRVRSFPHGAPLAGAALSHDGSLVVTAGDDGIAWIWKAKTGARVRPLKHVGPVTSAIFSPDDRVLATTSMDGYARIWDVRTGDLVYRMKHPDAVEAASMSGDGRLLVTVLAPEANDPVARVFDIRSGRRVSRLRLTDRVTTAHFAAKGDRVVAGSFGGDVRVWHARTGKLITKLSGHAQAVLDAEFSPAGDRIVTASTDHTARVWNAKTGDVITDLANQRDIVSRAHFSPDGESVVTASADGRASVFHAEGGLVQATLIGHTDSVVDAVFSPDPDGTTIVTASTDRTARLWDPHTDPLLQTVGTHRATVNSLAFSPDGRFVASGGDDKDVWIWRVGGGLVKTLATGGPVTRVAFSRDGSLLLAVSANEAVRLWRTSDWKRVATLRHRFAVTSADLSPDGRFVATADAEGVVRLWAVANPNRQRSTSARGRPIDAVAFSPDGSMLVTAGADKVARLWRVEDGTLRLLHRLLGHRKEIALASFSPDGRRLVTASKDRTARIWDTATGTLEQELRGHGKTITSASFSPDGRLVVTTGSDHKSHVWLAESGKQLKPLKQGQIVMAASFSADGRWLATAAPYAGVWETSNSDKLFLLKPRDGLLTAIAFSPTGWRIVTGGIDGGVQTYVCQLCGRDQQLVAIARARLARLHR
jgi:WD40 repeat protein